MPNDGMGFDCGEWIDSTQDSDPSNQPVQHRVFMVAASNIQNTATLERLRRQVLRIDILKQ